MAALFEFRAVRDSHFSISHKRAKPRKSRRFALSRRPSLVSFCPPPLRFRLPKPPRECVSDCALCYSGCLCWQSRRLPPVRKPDSANFCRFHSAPLSRRQRSASGGSRFHSAAFRVWNRGDNCIWCITYTSTGENSVRLPDMHKTGCIFDTLGRILCPKDSISADELNTVFGCENRRHVWEAAIKTMDADCAPEA